MAVSVTRLEDRVAAAAAFEEAAIAAVVEDLVDAETARHPASTTAGCSADDGMPTPGRWRLRDADRERRPAARSRSLAGRPASVVCVVIAARLVALGLGLAALLAIPDGLIRRAIVYLASRDPSRELT